MAVIAITGTGSGIGRALAGQFRRDGFVVAGCDLPEHVRADDDACDFSMGCDVSSAEETQAFVDSVIERFGRLDGFIANAGLGRRATIADGDWADIEQVVRVNLFGVLHSFRAALKPMTEAGYGRLVAVASRNAELCPGGLVGYNASKAGVVATVRTLYRELKETGSDILVNNLIPGPSATGMNPTGERDPGSCYPTARMLVTLPEGGPSGRTFFDEQEYPMWSRFSGARS